MKKYLLLTISTLISLSFNLFADWIPITLEAPTKPSINAVSSNIQTTIVNFNLSGFYLNTVQTPNGEASIATVDMASQILEEGAPDLAKLDASIIIPDEAEMQINVLSSSFRDYPNITIAPSKGNLTRDIDPNTVPYRWGSIYEVDRFYPEILTDMREPYILKDYRGQTILTYPFQYNPVTKVLRVYYDMTVEVSVLNQTGGLNQKNRNENSTIINTQFKGIYKNHFINFFATHTRYTPVEEQGRMIVISHGPFMEAMQPFVNWKNQKGIPTTIVNVSTIGNNTTAIKNYIQTEYNLNDGLAFILLIGDGTQIATPSAAGGSSDPSYALLEGNDNYPDIFVGRFSAENVTQVQTQVTKTVHYERDLVSGDWLKKGMGIASSEGAGIGDNGEADWVHMDIIRNKLLDYTYSTVDQVYANNGGNATMITNNVNYGRSEICYCGHGSATTWVTTGYSNSNVNALTNDWKLPYIHSVACVNGQFANTTCFAEAWLRATNNSNGNPTGAVAMYASSINQSWAPPMRGQDEYIDLFVDEEMSSIAGLWYNSSCGMIDAYGTDGANMYKTWHIFGDPSLQVKTDTLSQIAASYLPNIMIGMENFEITTDAPNSLVCLSSNNEIIAYGYADNSGFINLDLINLPDEPTDLLLTITALNRITVVDTVELIPSNVPFLLFNSFSINDSETGNGNGQTDYGENLKLTVNLRNVGSLPADSVSVTLSSDSPFITFVEGTANYLSIASDSIYGLPDGFEITLNKNVPDMEPILINIQSVCQDTLIWNSSFQLIAHSPVLNLEIISVLDEEGNNNGKLDIGETAQVTIQIKNNGTSDICNAVANLNSVYEFLEIEEEIFNYDTIAANTSKIGTWNITISEDASTADFADFSLNIIEDEEIFLEENFYLIIGQIPVLVLDLDNNNNSGTAIHSAISTLGIQAVYSTTFPADLNIYKSIFVCLGTSPQNHELTLSEGARLANYLNNGNCLYMEGADTWYEDQTTAVHQMFKIQGISDGGNDISTINGQINSFTEGMAFPYSGDNSYIDRINAVAPAFSIFKNQYPLYTCAVAYNQGTYKTIGSSFEFGGLVNSEFPSTKSNLVIKYLEFFDLIETESMDLDLANGWNMISIYLEPRPTDIDSILSSIRSDIRIMKNSLGQTYIPAYNINTLGEWNIKQGYMIYTTDDVSVSIQGYKIAPEFQTISLPGGWRLIPYLRDNPMDIAEALSSIVDNIIIVKNQDGGIFVPLYNINTIGNMQALSSYNLCVSEASDLVYPANNSSRRVIFDENKILKPKNKVIFTDNSMVAILDFNENYEGKEIGAFNSEGKLVGASVVQNGKAAIVIYGKDEFTEEAASDGELITFRDVNENNNFSFEFNNITDVISGNEIKRISYKKDAAYAAKVILEEGISNETPVKALPNPANNSFKLEFNLIEVGNYEILIYSSTGILIDKISKNFTNSGFNYFNYNSNQLATGLYNVIIRGANYQESCKVLIAR